MCPLTKVFSASPSYIDGIGGQFSACLIILVVSGQRVPLHWWSVSAFTLVVGGQSSDSNSDGSVAF